MSSLYSVKPCLHNTMKAVKSPTNWLLATVKVKYLSKALDRLQHYTNACPTALGCHSLKLHVTIGAVYPLK
jgi:hypothetical protein